MRIAVIYCGGCNPEIEREALVKRLGAETGHHLFPLGRADLSPDLVLLVNGCARGCMDARSIGVPGVKAVVVAGAGIDGWAVAREDLAGQLIKRIKEFEH